MLQRVAIALLVVAACANDPIPGETITAPTMVLSSARQQDLTFVSSATGSFLPTPNGGFPLSPACTTIQGAENKPNWGLHTSLPLVYGGSPPYVTFGSGFVDDGRISYQWGGSGGTWPPTWSPVVIRTLSWATPGLYDLPVTIVDNVGDTLTTSVTVSIPLPDYSHMQADGDWTQVGPAREIEMPVSFVAHCKFLVVEKEGRVHISHGWGMGKESLVTTGGGADVRFLEESGVIQGSEARPHGRFQAWNPDPPFDPHIRISVPPVSGLIDLRLNVTDGTQNAPWSVRIWVY